METIDIEILEPKVTKLLYTLEELGSIAIKKNTDDSTVASIQFEP